MLPKKPQVFENEGPVFEAATGLKVLNECYRSPRQRTENGFSQHIAEFLPVVVKTVYFCAVPVQEEATRDVGELKSLHLNRQWSGCPLRPASHLPLSCPGDLFEVLFDIYEGAM